MKFHTKLIITCALTTASYNLYAEGPKTPPKCDSSFPACKKGIGVYIPQPDLSKGKIVFDFDRDSCLASSPIIQDGTDYKANEGLDVKNTGGLSDNCSYVDQLASADVLYKNVCAVTPHSITESYCAQVFAIYTVKDMSGKSAGHAHDLEHVVLWMKNGKVDEVGTSAHDGLTNKIVRLFPRLSRYSDKPNYNSFTVVYHKDGGTTHALRPSKSAELKEYETTYNLEAAENPTERWFTPNIVNVDSSIVPDTYKAVVKNGDWGSAKLKIKDDETVRKFLNSKLPGNWRKSGVKF